MARKAASFRSTARLAPSSPRDLYIRDWPGSVGPDAGLPLQETLTIVNVFGNAQASIKQTYNAFGNAQADIKQTYNAFGQSQADIKQTYNGFGQAQGTIIKTYQVYGNAQGTIRAFGQNAFGQAQGTVKAISFAYGNAQADIKQTYNGFGQSQGTLKQIYNSFGQAQGYLQGKAYGQAQGTIKVLTRAYGQAQGYISPKAGYGQAQAFIAGPIINFTGFDSQDIKMEIPDDIGAPSPSKFNIQNTIAYKGSGYALQQERTTTSTADFYFLGWSDPRGTFGHPTDLELDTIYVEFQFRAEQFPSTNDDIVTFLRDSGDDRLRLLYIQATSLFQLQYWTGGAWTNVTSASFSVTTGLWYRIGMSLQTLGNGDEIIVGLKLNGTDVISPTRLNPSGTLLPVSFVQLGSVNSISPMSYFWDDIVIRTDGFQNTSGTTVLTPDGNGNYTGWTNDYLSVDELPPDNGSTLIALGDGNTGKESVTLSSATSALPTNIQRIDAVKLHAKALRYFGEKLNIFYRISGTDYEIDRPDPFQVDGSVYFSITDTKSLNPNTNLPWAKSDLDSLEIGVDKTAASGTSRVTSLFLTILYTPFTGGFGQAQALIEGSTRVYGNAQAKINAFGVKAYGNAQGYILNGINGFGQAQGTIKQTYNGFGQAQGLIVGRRNAFGRAQATIKKTTNKFGQAQAFIIKYTNAHGQAQAYVKLVRFGYGQAQAQITTTTPAGQAQAFILSQRYLVQYNGYQLPGYAQAESFDSIMKIETAHQPYRDMSFSEYLGLENKTVSLRILVMGDNYLECKNQIQLASTMLRSQRAGFRPLYVQHYYKHYDGLVKTIKLESDVHTNTTAEYVIEFECKPWLESDILTTISGTSLISTVGRTIYDGGWTPARLRLSGTNITVSGYTASEAFTGFISISGVVTDLEINTEAYTATINDENANSVILNDNYQVYIGPEMTYFDISGATECEISYHDRWYL